jgi:hypothetical protein
MDFDAVRFQKLTWLPSIRFMYRQHRYRIDEPLGMLSRGCDWITGYTEITDKGPRINNLFKLAIIVVEASSSIRREMDLV